MANAPGIIVIPAKAGIQSRETGLVALDARFRGHDEKEAAITSGRPGKG
jgi:hypothetical protein